MILSKVDATENRLQGVPIGLEISKLVKISTLVKTLLTSQNETFNMGRK